MMQYAEKLQIQQEARRHSFDYSSGVDLNVKFDSSKKHSLYRELKPPFLKLCQR